MFGRGKRLTNMPMVCHMTVGEPDADGWYRVCGAPATQVVYQRQNAWDDVTAPNRQLQSSETAALAFCEEHHAAWQAAQGFEGGREAFPAGTVARLEREANKQTQAIVDTVMAAMTQAVTTRFKATEKDVAAICDAIRHAVEIEQARVFKPVSTTPGQPHKPVLLA